jgi:hypothetical protein
VNYHDGQRTKIFSGTDGLGLCDMIPARLLSSSKAEIVANELNHWNNHYRLMQPHASDSKTESLHAYIVCGVGP